MSDKQKDKPASQPVADDSDDGQWVKIDLEDETGNFAIIPDVLPPAAAPKPKIGGELRRRRTLDDMRRLSDEIKRKRQSGG